MNELIKEADVTTDLLLFGSSEVRSDADCQTLLTLTVLVTTIDALRHFETG